MQFIIFVALHVCPICATKEKPTTMVTMLYQIKNLKNYGLHLEGFVSIRWDRFSIKWWNNGQWINTRCLKFIKNVIKMQNGQLLTRLEINLLFRFLNHNFIDITLIIFKCNFSISQLQQTNQAIPRWRWSLLPTARRPCQHHSPRSLVGWIRQIRHRRTEQTPSSGPCLDALCCSSRSITSFSPITFTLRLGLNFCQQIQIHVTMAAVIFTSTVLSFTNSLFSSHIIRAVVGIVVTSIIATITIVEIRWPQSSISRFSSLFSFLVPSLTSPTTQSIVRPLSKTEILFSR